MTKETKISGSVENWENGELGRDEKYAKSVSIDESEIDEALDLKPISIRLQKSLIEDLKYIARTHGIGYQTFIRQMLTRFSVSEKKRLENEFIGQRMREEREAKERTEAIEKSEKEYKRRKKIA